MKPTTLPLGIIVLLSLSACSGGKEGVPAAPVPAVSPAAGSSAAQEKVAHPQTRAAKPVRHSVKEKAPKPTTPVIETMKKPKEIISTRTIVS